jgi:hypothetical protein
VALCVVLSVLSLILGAELWSLPRRRSRVLVNLLHDEGTIAGVLWNRRGCWLVVKDARLLRPNGDSVTIDGEVVIDKDRVAFLQVL